MEQKYSVFDNRKKEFIKRIVIDNKEEIIWDIFNIEHSFSGRMDTPNANLFIMESVQLLINSIELFEQGYFDCAYYSLRESIEVSTTLVFLSDLSDEERKEKMRDWRNLDKFPLQKPMLNYLSVNGEIFSDMKLKLKDYFEEVNTLSQKLNKIVHKQGFQNFYLSRNHPINTLKYNEEEFKQEFIENLTKCIGVVAVMRLAIDPFPILLMDYEIYSRCFDSMTDAYTEDFVNKYIGEYVIENYKKTDIYVNHYNGYITEEQKNPTVLDIVKHKCINTQNKKEIMEQLHLLNKHEYYITLLAINFDKVCKLYSHGGFQMYFTDKKTNRKNSSWNSLDFVEFSKNPLRFNQKYDEAFISVVNLDDDYYIEHNELLSNEEIEIIKDFERKVQKDI